MKPQNVGAFASANARAHTGAGSIRGRFGAVDAGSRSFTTVRQVSLRPLRSANPPSYLDSIGIPDGHYIL